jgi:hypothetical protein
MPEGSGQAQRSAKRGSGTEKDPSPPFRAEGEGPSAKRWEGEVGIGRRSGIPHLTPTLSAPGGGEGGMPWRRDGTISCMWRRTFGRQLWPIARHWPTCRWWEAGQIGDGR